MRGGEIPGTGRGESPVQEEGDPRYRRGNPRYREGSPVLGVVPVQCGSAQRGGRGGIPGAGAAEGGGCPVRGEGMPGEGGRTRGREKPVGAGGVPGAGAKAGFGVAR